MLELITAPETIIFIAILAVLSILITLTGLLFRNKKINLLSGEISIIITAYYAMQTALEIETSAIICMIIWFLVASINFVIVTIGYKKKKT
ncbi:hypothetical protein K9M50_01350 [Patescibacteria group bacterium]|nr:hypothetical protein [Patescibacteria group bacterium]